MKWFADELIVVHNDHLGLHHNRFQKYLRCSQMILVDKKADRRLWRFCSRLRQRCILMLAIHEDVQCTFFLGSKTLKEVDAVWIKQKRRKILRVSRQIIKGIIILAKTKRISIIPINENRPAMKCRYTGRRKIELAMNGNRLNRNVFFRIEWERG